jgi:hypothetical protein
MSTALSKCQKVFDMVLGEGKKETFRPLGVGVTARWRKRGTRVLVTVVRSESTIPSTEGAGGAE